MMMMIEKKRWMELTSVGSGCGICCNGKACQGNQRHRTCSKRFDDPPLLWCGGEIENQRFVTMERRKRGIWEVRVRELRRKKKKCDQ